MQKTMMKGVFVLLACVGVAAGVMAQGAGGAVPDAIWADDHLYGTVATPTELPPHGPTDRIYAFANLPGQRSVAEAKPGDRDYNGGRWQVTVLTFTEEGLAVHDEDGNGMADFELTSWEQVQEHIGLGHLEVAGPGPRFVCPLLP